MREEHSWAGLYTRFIDASNLFLWREKEKAGEDEGADGEVINLRLAKHRNGPTGEVKLWFKKSQTRFVSYAAERYAQAV
jgi:replicative DNA helicase